MDPKWAATRDRSEMSTLPSRLTSPLKVIIIVELSVFVLRGSLATGLMLTIIGYLAGFSPVELIFAGGFVVAFAFNAQRLLSRWKGSSASVFLLSTFGLPTAGTEIAHASFSLTSLFVTFLKLGSVVFGSGYVLLAFLRNDFVHRLGWLSDQQILDAVAVGQFTPGPVFTTATFIGYLVGGFPGSMLATVGIFLPSFIFVAVVFPLVAILRRSSWASGFLDGVNVAALGLMAGVTWQLGRAALVDPFTGGLALLALIVTFRFKINSAWLVLGGAVIGVLYRWIFRI